MTLKSKLVLVVGFAPGTAFFSMPQFACEPHEKKCKLFWQRIKLTSFIVSKIKACPKLSNISLNLDLDSDLKPNKKRTCQDPTYTAGNKKELNVIEGFLDALASASKEDFIERVSADASIALMLLRADTAPVADVRRSIGIVKGMIEDKNKECLPLCLRFEKLNSFLVWLGIQYSHSYSWFYSLRFDSIQSNSFLV